MNIGAWLFAVCAAVLVLVLWAMGHKSIRDTGGYSDGWVHFVGGFYRWPWDKSFHAAGAFVGTLLGVYVFGAPLLAAAVVVMLAGVAVEFAEKYPRQSSATKIIGRFSEKDLAADGIGVALAWAVVWAVSR